MLSLVLYILVFDRRIAHSNGLYPLYFKPSIEDGICDIARIGRLKIENRPMVLLRYSNEDLEGQIVLQQAETVRLVSPKGKLVSITEIQAGDRIAVISDTRFRHTGIAVEGKVIEK